MEALSSQSSASPSGDARDALRSGKLLLLMLMMMKSSRHALFGLPVSAYANTWLYWCFNYGRRIHTHEGYTKCTNEEIKKTLESMEYHRHQRSEGSSGTSHDGRLRGADVRD